MIGAFGKGVRGIGLAGVCCAPFLTPAVAFAEENVCGGPLYVADATRIETSEAPVIDGDLGDSIWQRAPAIDNLRQMEPDEGKPLTERTAVRLLYDENTIYVSFYNYDSHPEEIIARVKARDGDLTKDDFVRVFFDPYMSRRNAYLFEVNPLGARSDVVTQNNTDYLQEWDTIWAAEAKIVADGWTVEMAIPFRSMSYDPDVHDWGFELYRMIRRKSERGRWACAVNAIATMNVSEAGTLRGIHDVNEGMGLEAQVYGTARVTRVWDSPSEVDETFEPSGNFYYKITPSLTGMATFNTDFSDTPQDERQVNTGRFGLFFPETRDFFLQDVAVFEFGGRPFSQQVPGGNPNGTPFFSRQIGLANGVPVDIRAGGKLSGQIGDLSIGALTTYVDGAFGSDPQVLSVARGTLPVLGSSKVGFIFTNGDPTGLDDNTLAGADFQYHNTEWFGQLLHADFWYQRSFSNLFGEDDSFGFEVAYPNEPFATYHQFREIGDSFFPALGFVNRPGIREYNGNFVYRINEGPENFFRWHEMGTWYTFTTGLDDTLQSRENGVWYGFFANTGDLAFVNLWNDYEAVPFPFLLPHNVVIPAGEYTWTAGNFYIETAHQRELALIAEVDCCTYYNGDYYEIFVRLDWRPDETFEIVPFYDYQNFVFPTGDLEIQIAGLETTINITPDMQVLSQAQWDNISNEFGLLIRYRWEYLPGSEIFAAVSEGAIWDGEEYDSHATQLSLRVGYRERF